MTQHGFCGLHRIAYNRRMDYGCPQCIVQGVTAPVKQYDFDKDLQQPVDAQGKPLDPGAITAQV